jgi:predicted nucleotidyltransferase component of viral defense system
MASILTDAQQSALKYISESNLARQFYFSGGTALAYYYLQHRKSEDLDFFREEEFDPLQVTITVKSLQNKLGFTSFDYQNSFNRNLYFLHFGDESVLKLEFTYYPFRQIESPMQKDHLFIDSVIDIAANKLFTISQKPRGRDYFDLYFIHQKYGFEIEKLRMLAKQKFDWDVDPLHLGTQLDKVDTHLDDPILVKNIDKSEMIKFFQDEAQKLRNQILEK